MHRLSIYLSIWVYIYIHLYVCVYVYIILTHILACYILIMYKRIFFPYCHGMHILNVQNTCLISKLNTMRGEYVQLCSFLRFKYCDLCNHHVKFIGQVH